MRYQVPQFIEIEDKIVGPLTITQFVFLAGGFGFLVALWLILPLWLAILLGGPVAVFGLALAFYKVNDRPFIMVLQHGLQYALNHKLYIWDKDRTQSSSQKKPALLEEENDPAQFVPAATASKIKDLAWSLDVREKNRYGRENPL
jgi:hypothetical protein